jgi:type IV pilus assembly protein PilW
MTRTPPFASRSRQAGFTLIELMVSLAIGMAVVGALLAAYFAAMTTSRHSDALSQMAEDATLALNVIRNQVSQAGFSMVTGLTGTPPTMVRNAISAPIFGCEGANFVDPSAANGTATCNPTGTAPDAIEVAYEATNATGSSAVLANGKPVDCIGNNYAAQPGGWYLNDSKFYISNGTLYCQGPSGAAPLVDHVENLQVRYGIASGKWGDPGSNQILYFSTADQVGTWDFVTGVNICVQVRSADKVVTSDQADALGSYFDCDNIQQQNSDGYMRRTFTTTIVLQTHIY